MGGRGAFVPGVSATGASSCRSDYNFGLVCEAEQRPAKAEEAYQTAIGWEGDTPEDIQPHLDWGMLLRQGKIAKAAASADGRGARPRSGQPARPSGAWAGAR